MSSTKRRPSLAGSSREPFGKVTRLEQIPTALFEILALATEIDTTGGRTIKILVDGVIDVALADPEAWIKIQKMAANGYKIAFSRQESESPVTDIKE